VKDKFCIFAGDKENYFNHFDDLNHVSYYVHICSLIYLMQ